MINTIEEYCKVFGMNEEQVSELIALSKEGLEELNKNHGDLDQYSIEDRLNMLIAWMKEKLIEEEK